MPGRHGSARAAAPPQNPPKFLPPPSAGTSPSAPPPNRLRFARCAATSSALGWPRLAAHARCALYGPGGQDGGARWGRGAPEEGAGPVLGRLEEEALRRRERLKALRQRTLQSKDGGERENKIPRQEEEEEEEPVKHKEIKLRNYEPEDEELKKRKLPPGKPASVEDTVKEQLEAAKPEPIIDEVDLANLAPRKPDWDLKRDVSKKLEKLERRTQRAIAELIRERLKGQEEELASAVGSAKQEGSDSD
ncbi:coiled-coil domain-containing protein 12 [Myiozetetes cayanensis]|uniref:coiled-coil domain-containing protein 12 n=1 Tax=Myiozetetes cayanensis TaxID=478635 RepID=UPI00215FB51E|nr:coiled-coil domain-containing protein 12 [Myiozetetes cayanensis]